jgi:hypothetical protein
MKVMSESEQLDQIIERFSSSERALRSLLEVAERLDVERQDLAGARAELTLSREESIATLEEVRRNLVERFDRAESSLGDVSSGVYGLTLELKDSARDLRDLAISWRAIGPEKVTQVISDLAQEVSDGVSRFVSENDASKREIFEKIDKDLLAVSNEVSLSLEKYRSTSAARQRILTIWLSGMTALIIALGAVAIFS